MVPELALSIDRGAVKLRGIPGHRRLLPFDPGQLMTIRADGWVSGEISGGVQHARFLIALVQRQRSPGWSCPLHSITPIQRCRCTINQAATQEPVSLVR